MQSDCNAGICEIRVPTLRRLRTLHPAARSVVPVNGVSAAPSATNPLVELSLSQLRERTSMKWRAHPADVLPLWVAEMDVLLAPPIAAALTDAIARGDTGYPVGTAYAEAVRDFAAERWGWHGLAVERTAVVPDVMMGIVEILRLLTEPGDPVVVCAPVYPPFYAFVSHA